ncbi:hypothetical protein F4604DRAFT_1682839 [Suillus subluteus]|nr:hypothetical protein F4604DRAFT_1682839 [Suillus subluteus]
MSKMKSQKGSISQSRLTKVTPTMVVGESSSETQGIRADIGRTWEDSVLMGWNGQPRRPWLPASSQGNGSVLAKSDIVQCNMEELRGASMKGPHALKEVKLYSQMYYANHIKQSADNAIADSGITSHGSKLHMHQEITAEKYEAESIDVKEKVKKEHQKLQKKFKKARKATEAREEVDNDTKIKAIHELLVMLDHIFRHLSYMTGGWKFSVLMGGRDPEAGGNMRFFDYHLGECTAGGQFADSYVMYSEVLKALRVSWTAPSDSLPATNCNHDRDVECNDDNSAGEGSDTEADEDCTGESTAAGIEEWNMLYQLTPNKCNASQDEYNASHTELNLVSSMDGFSQASKPLDYDINYNGLQPADYEAVMLSLLEMPSMDSEGTSSHLQTQCSMGLTPPAPPALQPGPSAPATPRPTSPSTFEPDTVIPAPQAQPPMRTEALGPTPPATSKAPETPKPPLAGSQTDPVILGPQPPVTIDAPAHTPSTTPIPPAPPASQKAPASEPCAHHVEDEQPGAWHTGRKIEGHIIDAYFNWKYHTVLSILLMLQDLAKLQRL